MVPWKSGLTALALFLSPLGALPAQGGVDVHRLPLGHPVYKYDLRLLVRGGIYDSARDRRLSFEELIRELRRFRVILLGEEHDNLAIHRFQARVVEALARGKEPLVVGMEFFQPSDDPLLEQYVRGERGLVSLLAAADWPAKGGFNYRYYQPILEAARLGGARIVGLNVPREVVKVAARKGVVGLTAEQRSLFPPLDLSIREHRYLLRCFFGKAAVGNPAFFEKFYAAQVIWDTAMAANALAALDRAGPDSRVAVIVGNGHVLYGLGIGRRIRMLRPEIPVAEVVLLPVEAAKAPPLHPMGKAVPKRSGRPGKKKPSRPAGKARPSGGVGPKAPARGKKGASPPKRAMGGHPGMGMGAPGRVVSRSLGTFLVGTAPSRGEYPSLPMRLALRGGKVVVASLSRGGGLAKAGLRKGDQVLEIGGRPCGSPAEEMVRLMTLDWGDLLEIRARRGRGAPFTVAFRLRRPSTGKGRKEAGKKKPPAPRILHHDLRVSLDPGKHLVTWTDEVTLPGPLLGRRQGRIVFRLNPLFRPVLAEPSGGVRLRLRKGKKKEGRWELLLPPPFPGARKLVLKARGRVFRPPSPQGGEYARGFQVTPGTLEKRGVFLSGGTGWVPAFDGAGLFTFTLTVEGPASWEVISQGKRVRRASQGGRKVTVFREEKPQEEVYLVGGPLEEFDGNAPGVETMVFLHEDDPGLAGRYLAASAVYLSMYSRMLGRYPWSKFATVENFWETGYGMPSFTLLGPRVIRFPWILHSSFPHEILHNWWGNGVYVKMEEGNWCEGLTAYLADHLLQEQRGKGWLYRRQVLEKYTNFASGEGRDFPLCDFRERHSPATEAVGYGKSLMVFHMLRRRLGRDGFLEALRAFYQGRKFRRASWTDLEKFFEAVSGSDLSAWFAQWIRKKGAPLLRPLGAEAVRKGDAYELVVRVRQEQAGPPRLLMLPYAVHLKGHRIAVMKTSLVKDREALVKARFSSLPLRVDLDPRFDLFRRLLPREIPPTVGALLGARKALVVPPPEGLEGGYQALVSLLRGSGCDVEVARFGGTDLEKAPLDRVVWVLGSSNPLLKKLGEPLRRVGGALREGVVVLGDGRAHPLGGESLVLALPFTGRPGRFLGFFSLAQAGAGAALARKIPHYGKYGFLAFQGSQGINTAKGRWVLRDSPMNVPVRFGGKLPTLPVRSILPGEKPLWPAPSGAGR